MSRHKELGLIQLRQTIQGKLSLLQQQRDNFIALINEFINEILEPATDLLKSDNSHVDMERYLDVIRHLDQGTQVCVQLTATACNFIDCHLTDACENLKASVEVPAPTTSLLSSPPLQVTASSLNESQSSTSVKKHFLSVQDNGCKSQPFLEGCELAEEQEKIANYKEDVITSIGIQPAKKFDLRICSVKKVSGKDNAAKEIKDTRSTSQKLNSQTAHFKNKCSDIKSNSFSRSDIFSEEMKAIEIIKTSQSPISADQSIDLTKQNSDSQSSEVCDMDTMFNQSDMDYFDVMISTVNSPSDFYVHRISAETGSHMKSLMENLNRYMEQKSSAVLQWLSHIFVVKQGAMCCARFSKDNSFYRAIILDAQYLPPNNTQLEIYVFYIDYGDKEWLPSNHVFPLPQEYQHVAPQALWCSLAFIQPIVNSALYSASTDGQGKTTAQWSYDVVKAFKDLAMQDRALKAFGKLPESRLRADDVQKFPLPIFLVDVAADNLCINHELVLQGHAALQRLQAVTSETDSATMDDCNCDSDEWNDMEADADSLRNTYNVEIDDAGVAVTGIKSHGPRYGICRYYNTPGNCWKENQCPYLHTEPGMQRDVSGNLKKVLVFDEDQSLILPKEGSLVAVEVSCLQNPSFFYIVQIWGPNTIDQVASQSEDVKKFLQGETLESLNKAMTNFYKDKRLDTDYSLYAPGEAVAAQSKNSNMWLRAKIMNVDPDKEKVQVIFVDFGDTEWVPEHNIRQLDMRFIHLPPQALECCLAGVVPPQPYQSWPKESGTEMFKMVNEKTLVAFIVKRLWGGRLVVALYDTTEKQDINIGQTLTELGLADQVDISGDSRGGQGSMTLPSTVQSSSHVHSTEINDTNGQKIYYVPG